MEAAGRLPERIALDVEDDVAGRWSRQQREAAAGIAVDPAPWQSTGHAPLELQRSLVAQRGESARCDVRDVRRRRRQGECLQRGEVRPPQRRDIRTPGSRDEHQAVFGTPGIAAHAMELAKAARLDWMRLGGVASRVDRFWNRVRTRR
jgi:hypothetical protein